MSKKMKLRLEDIKVKSFVTTIGSPGKVRAGGTVVTCDNGHTCLPGCPLDSIEYTYCEGPVGCPYPPSDPNRNTCGPTCEETCHMCTFKPCTVGECAPL